MLFALAVRYLRGFCFGAVREEEGEVERRRRRRTKDRGVVTKMKKKSRSNTLHRLCSSSVLFAFLSRLLSLSLSLSLSPAVLYFFSTSFLSHLPLCAHAKRRAQQSAPRKENKNAVPLSCADEQKTLSTAHSFSKKNDDEFAFSLRPGEEHLGRKHAMRV